MAYAGLAGLSPIYGLYCAIAPAMYVAASNQQNNQPTVHPINQPSTLHNSVYVIFGPSRESAIGAMALVSIMVGDAVASATPAGAPLHDRVAVAVKLAFLTGVFQLCLGLLKMGEIATYVSHPVMQGFSSGGEILIAISQLKMLFGIKIPSKKYAWQTLYYLFAHIKETQPWTLLMGVITCAFLYALSKWRRATKARMEVGGGCCVVFLDIGWLGADGRTDDAESHPTPKSTTHTDTTGERPGLRDAPDAAAAARGELWPVCRHHRHRRAGLRDGQVGRGAGRDWEGPAGVFGAFACVE